MKQRKHVSAVELSPGGEGFLGDILRGAHQFEMPQEARRRQFFDTCETKAEGPEDLQDDPNR